MFQLFREEYENLRFQFGTSSTEHGGRRYMPFVFTEQGVAMLSTVLRSRRAIQVNIMIMRAFVRLRRLVSLNRALAKRLAAIERRLAGHDADVQLLYQLIQDLHQSPQMEGIGFRPDADK
ncbi:MAG: ORF6N domain-containing protein [Elusimicrobia bacterium]|nr:ORF6N domain-containing protein [Elusimicrobiota bacterium]